MDSVKINLGQLKNSCFVVMPFNPLYEIEYKRVLKPTIESHGIECVRGDEIYAKQSIMSDIWKSIRECRFVIAELSGKNPNVMYEVGLAHALGKPVIIITRNAEDVPFDLRHLRYLFYDINDPFWGDNLKSGLDSLIYKVIDNSSINNYLDGIEKMENQKFPEIKEIKTKPKTTNINLNGEWKGSYSLNGLHTIFINIKQNDTNLSATAIITDSLSSSVHLVLTGFIKEDTAELKGVNYTFLNRTSKKPYYMDDFKLTSFEENKIKGKVTDELSKKEGALTLERTSNEV